MGCFNFAWPHDMRSYDPNFDNCLVIELASARAITTETKVMDARKSD